MQDRRQFLRSMGVPAVAMGAGLCQPGCTTASDAVRGIKHRTGTPEQIASQEDFWFEVARAFTVDRSIINFNNGGVSPSPRFVQEAMKRHQDFSNECPAYTMVRILGPQREGVRQRMARAWSCDPEEIALTRNASESLQICQNGFDLRPGDEVLCTTQDYPRMINTFKQRVRREGIVLKQFDIPTPAEDPAEIVKLYRKNITAKTRLILVSHVIFLTGQILPVREIAAVGRERGIPVIVDGAHALANVDFKLSDLDCDYYASSLHKWLFAPHGTGLLYVRRNKIAKLWPLTACAEKQTNDIRKFEEIGTHPAAPYLAIAEALTFHEGIGGARKEARLLFLRDRWARRLLRTGKARLHTSLKRGRACGIATVSFDGVEPESMQKSLWQKHRILTTTIRHEDFQGVRVSPSVYTTLSEVDRFCAAVENVLANPAG
ncbi:MAG: aminotransferase class V-fold PLP-dependent enzyme [Planctomycetota bacterium]|jgi:selenocysteine lyase/cysteine desulfurase